MLTNTTLAGSSPDGGLADSMGIKIHRVALADSTYQAIHEALKKHREELEAGRISIERVAELHDLVDYLSSMYIEARVIGIELKRGRRAGTGLKGGSRRAQRSINIAPEVWEEVEAQRLEGESLNDAVERILRRSLKLIQ